MHRVVVLLVTDHDEHGRPKKCTMGYDETVFNLKGGEEFITAWVPEQVCEKKD